jgi:hypothetical protein
VATTAAEVAVVVAAVAAVTKPNHLQQCESKWVSVF